MFPIVTEPNLFSIQKQCTEILSHLYPTSQKVTLKPVSPFATAFNRFISFIRSQGWNKNIPRKYYLGPNLIKIL